MAGFVASAGSSDMVVVLLLLLLLLRVLVVRLAGSAALENVRLSAAALAGSRPPSALAPEATVHRSKPLMAVTALSWLAPLAPTVLPADDKWTRRY